MVSAAQIRKARSDLGETQSEFAKRFGVDQSTISRWEEVGIEGGFKALAARMLLAELKVGEAPSHTPEPERAA